MKTEIITDINQAETLWKKLSPKEYMYDLWPFRFAFYKHNPHPLNFITIYDGKNPVAMLPLQKNSETNELEFFGVYADFNRAFIKPGYEHQPIWNIYINRMFTMQILKFRSLVTIFPYMISPVQQTTSKSTGKAGPGANSRMRCAGWKRISRLSLLSTSRSMLKKCLNLDKLFDYWTKSHKKPKYREYMIQNPLDILKDINLHISDSLKICFFKSLNPSSTSERISQENE